MNKPIALFLAGTNGSGKSTYRFANKIEFLNLINIDPDKFIKDNNGNNALGSKLAINTFNACIKNKISFSMETTLSGKSVLNRIKQAKNNGFNVKIIYIGLDNSNLNIQRVEARVNRGGHNIETNLIIKRYKESRLNLIKSLPLIDNLKLYDNSTNKLIKCLEVDKQKLIDLNTPLKKWVSDVCSNILFNENGNLCLPIKNIEKMTDIGKNKDINKEL
ncbi:zeta toxin family protein [Campylobacter sp. RM12642]|uniref:zeta toxin family protein n=1 Tax=unclassified Campylobacter TaxID=2593542 RepID=UPI001D6CAF60|nr:zeta toxin family protein [Campylobacter sp. RM12642]MBZ8007122.1 zeta toxin family protein [Campylobacter sp. RM9334]